MPYRKKPLRLLAQVLKAVASFKDSQGSTARKIFNHVKAHINPAPRASENLAQQFQRALRHGLEYGLLRENSGRYKLSRRNGRKGKCAAPVPAKKTPPTRNIPKPEPKRKQQESSSEESGLEASEVETETSDDYSTTLSSTSASTSHRSKTVESTKERNNRRESGGKGNRAKRKSRDTSLSKEPKKSRDGSIVSKKPPSPESPSNQKPGDSHGGASTSFNHRRRMRQPSRPPHETREDCYDGNLDCLRNIKSERQEDFPEPRRL